MNYKTEEEFLDKVEKCLKKNGCKTWREVIPDQCKNWEKPYKVDLILQRDDFGFIGVEGKNLNTLRSGSIISKAIDQIKTKYENKTYFKGNIINKWCIAVPNKTLSENKNAHNEIIYFIKNFIKHRYNISFLELNENPNWKWKPYVIIDALTKNSLYFKK